MTEPSNLTCVTAPTDLAALTDDALIARVGALTSTTRESTADLIAHLVELERRNLHLACGFRSLYGYCRHVLRFSEPESYQRMQAAHVARRFPVIVPLLAAGLLHLAGVRLLAPLLKGEDHLAVLGGALGRSKREIEHLVARWSPKPAVPTSIRKQPAVSPHSSAVVAVSAGAGPAAADLARGTVSAGPGTAPEAGAPGSPPVLERDADAPTPPPQPAGGRRPTPPLIAPLSATDYVVKFTASEAMVARIHQAQELLSGAVPDGDVAEILDRGLKLLLEDAGRRKHAAMKPGRLPRPQRPIAPDSRTIPAAVQRQVWQRDGGRCAFVGVGGRRCDERRFLEYHHLKPWITGGPAAPENIALRCRAHNRYEAAVYFAPIRAAREVAGPAGA